MSINNSLVCCGLDPDFEYFPEEFRKSSSPHEVVIKFLKTVVDITSSHVCAYKAQKAFFDFFDCGDRILKEVILYIHVNYPLIPVFVDCKIGDIDNTMRIYLRKIFDYFEADGVVVNPYMGDEVMVQFESLPNKAAVVLVRTSNAGAACIQDVVLRNGKTLWQHVLDLVINRWNRASNMIPIIPASLQRRFGIIRKTIPEAMPILLAGYGRQGGTTDLLSSLVDSTHSGVFVNSSRGILYPMDYGKWREGIEKAVVGMKNQLNIDRYLQSA